MSIAEFTDTGQFEHFFNQYYARLVLFAARFTDDTEIARDIVQEVFLKTWENRESITINTSLKSYLFVAVRNRCANYIKQKTISDKFISETEAELKQMEVDYYGSAELQNSILYEQDTSEAIRQTIRELPEKCREIFELSRFDGLKSKEIAGKLQISVRTVETQIYRALRQLKEKLYKR
ncbi:MAG TPA: RNA polymerase sigma-70 factor [Bacteroidales bacterium]|jgi:RNA polymerase sigma-70 factor (ECF subfamily)|nr:RNA polymerase sigma-70 factor [Bacteroidales bacterium]